MPGGQQPVQRHERTSDDGRVDSLPAGTDLDRRQRAGEPAASPCAQHDQGEQRRAGDAGQQREPGKEELVCLREQVRQQPVQTGRVR